MSGPPMKGPYDPDRIRERVAAASMSDPTQAREALVEEVRAMLDTHACFQTDPPLIGVIELRRRLEATLAALPDDGREGLDVDRLAVAMVAERGVAWPASWRESDFAWVARQVGARYCALSGGSVDEEREA